jgi:hypothetical protein
MASRVEKLNNKGILAWEVDGVLGRLTGAQSEAYRKGEAFALAMKPLVEMGVIVATHVRERVQGQGQLAGIEATPPSDKRGWHKEGANGYVPGQVVSAEYAAAAGLDSTTYASSADLKAASGRQGVGNTSGGMWAGLQARGSGKSAVIIDFGGSSPGHGSGKPVYVPGAEPVGGDGGKPIPVMVRPPEMVRNQQKAWVVFVKNGASPLEPTDVENLAMCEAATAMMQKAVVKEFGDAAESNQRAAVLDFGGDVRLREKLLTGWVK